MLNLFAAFFPKGLSDLCVFSFFQVYGIDSASGAAVSALSISEGDHILDLCAAPGK